MRHQKKKKFYRGGHAQRASLLKQSALSFMIHGRIYSTATRIKHIRSFVERLVTTGKNNTLSSRRQIIKRIGDAHIADKILKIISPKYANRAGGYTRVVKIGPRQGDGAQKVLMTWV